MTLMQLEPVFEEWTEFALTKKLLPRQVDLDVLSASSHLKIVGLTGLRRSGKSSLLMLLAQHLRSKGRKVAYVNMEDPRLRFEAKVWDSLASWFGKEEGYLLLDEVTSAASWDGWLMRSHELFKDFMHLVVTSSRSAFCLPPRPLRGRIHPVELFPLSLDEFLDFKGVTDRKTSIGKAGVHSAMLDYLHYGGFPEVALAQSEMERQSILIRYFQDIVALDVAHSSKFEVAEVELIASYMLQTPYFSASACLDYLGSVGFETNKSKLLSLERMMQESYLMHFSPFFAYGAKGRGQRPRKCYPGDLGFLGALTGNPGWGRLWESAAYLSCRRAKSILEEVCYWSDAHGREVDIVVRDGQRAKYIAQVCYDLRQEKVRRREIDSLVRGAKALRSERALLITNEEPWSKTVDGIEVEAMPLAEWLLR